MGYNRLVSFPSKDASLLIHGKDLWKLDCTESGCQWIELPQKLNVERTDWPVAMFLDPSGFDGFPNCAKGNFLNLSKLSSQHVI